MATGTLLTIDDFERLPAEMAENHELVNGALVDVGMNTAGHNGIRDFLTAQLYLLVRGNGLGTIFAEQGYDFSGNAHCPDVSFFGPAKLPFLDLDKRVQRFVPDLAIEIASKSDTYDGLLKKKDRYLRSGTQEVWIISSELREVRVCSLEQDRILRGKDVLSTALIPGFSITVAELFTEL